RNGTLPVIASIEPMHGNQLVTYGVGSGRQVLSDQLSEGHALACGNFAGPGNPQIVAGWRGKGGGIALFTCTEPDKPQPAWHQQVIDGAMACEDLCLADLNGDAKLDIIASGRATHNVKIYWNE